MTADPLDFDTLLARKTSNALLLTEHHGAPFGVPNEMLDMLGRPMLQRVVERLVRSGFSRIHVVLGENPAPIKDFLGDGARWGCQITYHHSRAHEWLGQIARRIDLDPEACHMVVDAAYLPLEDDLFRQETRCSNPDGDSQRAAIWKDTHGSHWSGWGVFRGQWLRTQMTPLEFTALEESLLASHAVDKQVQEAPLSVASMADLLRSNRRILAEQCVEETSCILVGRGCQIHPSAQLVAPVYIGDQVKIGADAQIGPNAILGHGVLVEQDARVHNAVVLADTYIGEGLEVTDSIAGGSLLANIRLDTIVGITDANLLSSIPRQSRARRLAPRRERITAMALRVALAPLHALINMLPEQQANDALPVLRTGVVMAHPAESRLIEMTARMENPRKAWRQNRSLDWVHHFQHSFYPGLSEVARGRLSLMGPTPRTLSEVRQLPETWQGLYATHRCGLINDSLFLGSDGLNSEIQYASDAMACVSQGKLSLSMKLVWRYLGQVMRNISAKPDIVLDENSEKVVK